MIRACRLKRAVDQIGGTIKGGLRLGGDFPRAAPQDTSQSHLAHQTLHRAPGRVVALATQLPPDLPRPIHAAKALLVDPLNQDAQFVIALGPRATGARVVLLRVDAKIRRRGDRQHGADRLDPVRGTVLVDLGGHFKTGNLWTVKTGNFLAPAKTGEFYFVLSSVRKSVWTFVRQLRGPHLST